MEIKQGGQKYYSVLIQIRHIRKSKAYGLVCGIALAGALAFSAGNVSAEEVTATDGSNALAVVTDHTQDNTQTTHTNENTSSAVQNVVIDNIAVTVANEKVDKQNIITDDINKEKKIEQIQSTVSFSQSSIQDASSSVVPRNTAPSRTDLALDQDKHLSGVVHEVESDDAFTIDHAIKVTDKQQDGLTGLTIRTITWDGNGPYHLEKAVNQIKDGQFPIWNKEAISEEATNRQISVIVSGGFWQLENADNTWSQKEINAGKTGILYSDGNGHVAATTLNNTSINQVFELQGENGWNTGAFGAFVIDGKLEPSFGKDSRWQGDPNEKNGRTLFIEYKDGKQEIVIINGHTSKKTGYSHTDIVDYVQQIGLDNIKLAFLLDGGGSTRGYTKADDGKQSIVGSFVDNRRVATYLYLTKESPKEETLNETNKDTKNESQSITYQQWKNAVDNNIETIPGTAYKNTNTDEVVESSQNIPYNTRYVSDETVKAGVRKIITQGENGTKNIITTYKRHNGVHTGKYTTSEAISKQPVDKVVSVGTKAVVSSTIIPIVEEVRENAKVPRGQRTTLQEGKEGNVTTTTSYKLLPDGNLSSSITEAREEMEPHIIEVGTGENVVLPIVTNYVGDDSLAKGAIQVIQSGEAHVEDVTGKVLTEGAPRIIHIGTRPQVSETDGLRMTTTYSVNPATGELSETSTAIPLVAPSQDELPDGYVVVDNPTEQKNQIDRDGLPNVLDKSSSSSNATENQNRLSVDMTKKAISSPSTQRIKEVGILPHTGEKSSTSIIGNILGLLLIVSGLFQIKRQTEVK